jgi:thiamine-phosphate pyrophosphorylase
MKHLAKKRQILLSERPLLYLITDRKASLRTQQSTANETELQLEVIQHAVHAGCRLIQVRERDLSSLDLYDFVLRVLEVARPADALVLVNDRTDIAIAAGADGVHLRSSSLRPKVVRDLVNRNGRNDFLIGASVHSVHEIAGREGADFLVFGPVFETPSKLEFGTPLGLDAMKEAVQTTTTPILGIGGINLGNFISVLDCGAAGVAAIGLFSNPETVAANVRAAFARGLVFHSKRTKVSE